MEYLLRWGLDHRPVLVKIKSKATKGRKGFKFDKRWLGKEGSSETVEQGWRDEFFTEQRSINNKIGRCRKAIL